MEGNAAPAVTLRRELHHGRVVSCHTQRPANIYRMFEQAVARAPDAVAVVDGDIRWTYADLAARAERCAARLDGLGLVPGERLGILIDNRGDYPVLLIAAARLGLIVVPMNIRQRSAETAYALQDSGAAALVYEEALAEQLPTRAEVPDVRHWLVHGEEAALWSAAVTVAPVRAHPPEHALDEDAPFCILYTSGTTGRPKGAVLTHFGCVTTCLGSRDHLGFTEGEAMVLSVPASHVTGIALVLLLSVCVAGKVVMQRGFKARRFLELAQAERVTYSIMVPAMYKLCLMEPDYGRFDLSRWRIGAYGGAPMDGATIGMLADSTPRLTLVNIYGSTETTSPAVMMPLGEGPSRPDQVGRPLPYAEIAIMDPDGRECARGEQGEIWIAGPMVVPRYWNNPEATERNFTGGYWRSGDIGTMDAQGYIRVLDRKKDMINRGGFKIYSVEVENVLMAHAAIVEAVVVGRPCPVLGERVEAFVVTCQEIEEDALRAFCAQRLSDYKVPDHVRAVPGPLPRNANGKLLKNVVRGWLPEDSA